MTKFDFYGISGVRLRRGFGAIKLLFEISGIRDAGRKMREMGESARGLAHSLAVRDFARCGNRPKIVPE